MVLLQGIVTKAVLSSVTVVGLDTAELVVGVGTLSEVVAEALVAGALESVASTVEYFELSVQLQSSKVRVVASVTV